MNFYVATVEELTHSRKRGNLAAAKRARRFCETLLGYRSTAINEQELVQARWRIEDPETDLRQLYARLREGSPPTRDVEET